MLTFKQKIFVAYILLFFTCICVTFSFTQQIVKHIIFKGMRDRALEIIERIQSAPTNEALVRRLRDQKHMLFFRVSVITDKKKTLYDSHIKRLLGPKFSQEITANHPEVLDAFQNSYGYHEDFSEILGQKFAYMALPFDFHSKQYVIRTAYPYKYISELTHYFEIGFLVLCAAVLLVFSSLNWFVIDRLLKPIQQIIKAVQPYQESDHTTMPEIILPNKSTNEVQKLAETLNSLSRSVQKYIDTVISERNEKSAILESLEEGVIAVDGAMRVGYVNQRALAFLSRERGEVLGLDFASLNQSECIELIKACQESGEVVCDTVVLRLEKGKSFIDLIASPIKGAGNGAVLVMQDKTAHHKILEMRRDFIANASHELKTPITVISGFAEALHDNPDLDEELRKEIMGKIMRNCHRMTKLIKDLLTLADIEHIPESRLIDCNPYTLLSHCCGLLKDAYPDATVSIIPEEGKVHITADPYLLEMAFTNLLENAAKYSNGPAEISVSLEERGERVEVKISDRGVGIPEKDLEHIFQRFYTVNKQQSMKKGGAGLGLSLVETIIEKHFGKISVQSGIGVGTTFTISLPKQRDVEEESGPKPKNRRRELSS